ncbi:MAG: nitrate- and nitrite sensing domain-containing protein [Streptomycetaceae bacterium]|nr:nitrate- and nitrite sensing domain-containing protein [Streptomycetaceae bacterium]
MPPRKDTPGRTGRQSPSVGRTTSRSRSGSLRTSLLLLALVPSLALAVVWAVASSQLLSEGLDIRSQYTLGRLVSRQSNDLLYDMQLERRYSVTWLTHPNSSSSHAQLSAERNNTDGVLRITTGYNLNSYTDRIHTALQPYFEAFQRIQLPNLRARVDQRDISPEEAANDYSAVLQAMMTAIRNVWQVQEGQLVTAAEPTSMMMFLSEDIALEDTIITQAMSNGRLTAEQRAQFVLQVGAQRSLLIDMVRRQGPDDRAVIGKIVTSADWQTMASVENEIINDASPGAHASMALPSSTKQWRPALDWVETQLIHQIQVDTANLVSLQGSTANSLLLDQGAASLAGLLALITSAVLSWRVTSSLLRRLSGLREATLELAEVRLPEVVARLNRGEQVDIRTVAPELDYGTDELGQVAKAFNAAQRTGIGSAVALADSRRGFQKVILGAARHTQNLVNRQLSLLDDLERKHQEPEVLEGLYQLDSQTTRMRRYEENLVIIAGGRPRRRWNEPVALADILRSATGEVADYQRITVRLDEGPGIVGHAVSDVVHLLAELMENATAYSPTSCPVWVRADSVGKGIAVEIEDRGIGMSSEEYAAVNQRLVEPPEFDVLALSEDPRLGTFVVALLAAHHGISVTLRPSAFGGTSAIVLIPEELIVRDVSAEDLGSESLMPDASMPKPLPKKLSSTPVPAAITSAAPTPRVAPLIAPVAALPRAVDTSAAVPGGEGPQASPPPLPQRVPQTNLVQELRHEPAAEPVPEEEEPRSSARPTASAIAAFQRGTRHARHARPNETPRSTAPTADASKKDFPR